MEERQSLQQHFRALLLTVVGQAFTAAGYHLQDNPMQEAGGLFRFHKSLDDDLSAYIEFQVLVYTNNEWVAGMPSRFRVTLVRSDQPSARISRHPKYVRRTLAELVVEDFDVQILPDVDHWWVFSNVNELGNALAEAGHLVVGYGMPWLSGDLLPPIPHEE